jgi:hypothetical protein
MPVCGGLSGGVKAQGSKFSGHVQLQIPVTVPHPDFVNRRAVALHVTLEEKAASFFLPHIRKTVEVVQYQMGRAQALAFKLVTSRASFDFMAVPKPFEPRRGALYGGDKRFFR